MMMASSLSDSVRAKYRKLTQTLIAKGRTIATMESCTAGEIVSLLTDTEGSSSVVLGSLVTYSNAAKILGGVPSDTISRFGVYSPETACAMAQAVRAHLGSDIGVGVTGTFSNADPNNSDSVPGEVYFAIASASGTNSFSLSVPALDSRFEYKLFVAYAVADRLLETVSD